MKTMTSKEFAEQYKVDYLLANSFLRLLESTGHVKAAGTRPNLSGRGKKSNLYEIPDKLEIDFTKPLAKT